MPPEPITDTIKGAIREIRQDGRPTAPNHWLVTLVIALAAVAIIAIGLFNSVMFPTIFTLAIEGLGEDTPQGSGLLCLAIVGGAIIPVVTGLVADRVGLSLALLVPAVCYIWIAIYGFICHRKAVA